MNQFCDNDSGQCTCKPHITSRQCSECEDGFWAFEDGCLPCGCDPIGTEPAGKCDKFTGQCTCKANVVGLKCDQCVAETFGFGISSELGCVQCTCNPAGTLNGSMLCDNVCIDLQVFRFFLKIHVVQYYFNTLIRFNRLHLVLCVSYCFLKKLQPHLHVLNSYFKKSQLFLTGNW